MVSEALKVETTGCASSAKLMRPDGRAAGWSVYDSHIPYLRALEEMRARAAAIADGTAEEAVWLLEHPALYSAGTSAKPSDLLIPDFLPVFEAGRGGQYTYHGPGQRVIYVMLDLKERGRDVRCLVRGLENWIIDTLAAFNIKGEQRGGRVGVWVQRPDKGAFVEEKIAAIGVRVSRWVSFHGISLNVSPDLSHYRGIVPCGITGHGVTSFEDLGQIVSLPEVDSALRAGFETHFGPTTLVSGASGLQPSRS